MGEQVRPLICGSAFGTCWFVETNYTQRTYRHICTSIFGIPCSSTTTICYRNIMFVQSKHASKVIVWHFNIKTVPKLSFVFRHRLSFLEMSNQNNENVGTSQENTKTSYQTNTLPKWLIGCTSSQLWIEWSCIPSVTYHQWHWLPRCVAHCSWWNSSNAWDNGDAS